MQEMWENRNKNLCITNNNMNYKGPWTHIINRTGRISIYNSEQELVCTINNCSEQEKLAKLLVRAPEMFRMLKELADDLQYSDENRGDQVNDIQDFLEKIHVS